MLFDFLDDLVGRHPHLLRGLREGADDIIAFELAPELIDKLDIFTKGIPASKQRVLEMGKKLAEFAGSRAACAGGSAPAVSSILRLICIPLAQVNNGVVRSVFPLRPGTALHVVLDDPGRLEIADVADALFPQRPGPLP